ncbi:AAA family ATPase [Diaphorobacter aerolatus]
MAINVLAAFECEPPVLDFIWPGFLAGTVGALVAPGATGKSFWALEAAMSIACSVSGGDLVGLAPHTPGAWFISLGKTRRPRLCGAFTPSASTSDTRHAKPSQRTLRLSRSWASA